MVVEGGDAGGRGEQRVCGGLLCALFLPCLSRTAPVWWISYTLYALHREPQQGNRQSMRCFVWVGRGLGWVRGEEGVRGKAKVQAGCRCVVPSLFLGGRSSRENIHKRLVKDMSFYM